MTTTTTTTWEDDDGKELLVGFNGATGETITATGLQEGFLGGFLPNDRTTDQRINLKRGQTAWPAPKCPLLSSLPT